MINDGKHVSTCGVSSSKPTRCKASSSKNSGSGKERSPSGKSHEGPQSAPASGSSNSPFITYSPVKINLFFLLKPSPFSTCTIYNKMNFKGKVHVKGNKTMDSFPGED